MIDIDEPTLEAMVPDYGRYPWSRAVFGQLLEGLARQQPAAIVFDILFIRPAKGACGRRPLLHPHSHRRPQRVFSDGAPVRTAPGRAREWSPPEATEERHGRAHRRPRGTCRPAAAAAGADPDRAARHDQRVCRRRRRHPALSNLSGCLRVAYSLFARTRGARLGLPRSRFREPDADLARSDPILSHGFLP